MTSRRPHDAIIKESEINEYECSQSFLNMPIFVINEVELDKDFGTDRIRLYVQAQS